MCWCVCFLLALLLVPDLGGAPMPGFEISLSSSALLGFWDGPILGNRARMIQVACIGMAVAIFILTRGHKQGR